MSEHLIGIYFQSVVTREDGHEIRWPLYWSLILGNTCRMPWENIFSTCFRIRIDYADILHKHISYSFLEIQSKFL